MTTVKVKWQFSCRRKNRENQHDLLKKDLSSINKLIDDATEYLEFAIQACNSRTGFYRRIWKQARTIMADNCIYYYNEEIETKILYLRYGNKPLGILTSGEWRFRKAMRILTEFSKTGKMTLVATPQRKKFHFEGALGNKIFDFIQYLTIEKGLSKFTMRSYEIYLAKFLGYCNKNSINSVEKINMDFLFKFLTDSKDQPFNRQFFYSVRGFVRYAYEKELIKINLHEKFPSYKGNTQATLPTTYQKEEIERLISSTERISDTGKRNYAIILLAARLGLRAGDIINLKFQNIDWDKNVISLIQSKTEKEVSLPLLPEIGNAIIDYLKYARPKSIEPYIFLRQKPPYVSFPTGGAVTQIVQRAFLNAGISVKGRRYGAHALRHSLSFTLLQNETNISIISEVLGHTSSDTTKKYYLRIDLKSMSKCMLDVTGISNNFYEQLGGSFYDKAT